MKKKKVNSKRSYKKGGEAWVSEKMANLPMYQFGTGKFGTPGGFNNLYNPNSVATLNGQHEGATVDNWISQNALQYPSAEAATITTPAATTTTPATIATSTAGTKIDDSNYLQGDYNLNGEANTLDNKDKFGNATGATNKDFEYIQGDANLSGTVDGQDKVDKNGNPLVNNTEDSTREQQFFNPYGGYDLATSAGMLGQSIKEKNTLGIVGSSAKLLSGLGRNVMGGMGLANREQFIKGEYDGNVRDAQRSRTMTMKEGGLYFMQKGGKNLTRPEINSEPDEIRGVPRVTVTDEDLPEYNQEMTDMYFADKASGAWDQKAIQKRQYDPNSAADTWEQKTGTSWSEAKRLGYTDGTAKDNQKLLSELNDERFRKEAIRSSPLKTGRVNSKGTPNKNNTTQEQRKVTPEEQQKGAKSYLDMMKSLPKSNRSQGSINAVKEKDLVDKIGRVVEVLGNPLKSFGHYAKYSELPAQGFSKQEDSDNTYDTVLGIINPASWGSYASNAADFVEQGDYGRAAESALGATPILGKLKYTKYIPFKKAAETFTKLGASTSKGVQVVNRANTAVGQARKAPILNNYFTPEVGAGVKQGQKALFYNGARGGHGYIPGTYRPSGFKQDGGYYQEGGEQPQEGQEQMMQQVAQALQGGAPPEEVMQQLIQAGVPEDQAVQMIQSIMQQLQGQQEQPQMQRGGYQKYTQYSDSYFQEGGEQQAQQPSAEQIIQAYAESIQQDPSQIMQQLQQMQPEEQQQAIQQMMAELQGGQEQQVMQRGGQIAKKLTGEYTLEEGENPNVNSEIENNEYVQTPDGKVTKAEGATHEKGGIEVELEPGTRIVSDHLKLGAKNAKHYSENFDLEVKANDTYAKVLKRFTTKSGLQKIVDEQEKVIAQLKKSEEAAQGSAMSESTAALNKQFLSEKLNTLEQEKTPLEEARKALMNDVFNKQEESKPAKEEEQEEFQYGGYKPSGKYGYDNIALDAYTKPGSTGWLLRESKESSEEEDKANYNPNYNYKIPTTHESPSNVWKTSGNRDGYVVPVSEYGQPTPQAFPKQKQTWETFSQFAHGGEVPQYQNGDRFNIWYASLEGKGYTGPRDVSTARKWQAANFPEDVVRYYTGDGQQFNAKHIDMAKAEYKDAFTAAGLDINRDSASFTKEEAKRIQASMGDRVTPKFLIDGHDDGKKDWRAPLSPFQMDIKPVGLNKQAIGTDVSLHNRYQAPEEVPAEVYDSPEERKARGEGAQFLNLPDQSPMMPDSLTGALKITRRYDRVDPMQLSANGQVAELQGQANTAMQNINLQPGAESAAAAANIAAITQQNIGKTYSEVNRANMAQDAQAQQFNAQVQMQEENARGADLKDYESKIYQAQAVTDANVRGYYNQLKAVDLANYNAVNNVNAMNQMYDHFGYTNNGVEQTGEGTKWNANDYLKAKETTASTEKSKSKRTSKARFGGKKK